MQEVILLRTHHADPAAEAWAHELRDRTGRAVVVVADESHGAVDFAGYLPKIALTPARHAAHGLFTPPDVMWRCGDYCLYAALHALPAADAFWLVEHDIRVHTDRLGWFFDQPGAAGCNFASVAFNPAIEGWMWHRTMLPFSAQPHAAMLQLCYATRPAVAFLLEQRRLLSRRFAAAALPAEDWPNDEVFVGSALAGGGFDGRTFEAVAPGFSARGTFGVYKPYSREWLLRQPADGRIVHPVKAGPEYERHLYSYMHRCVAEGRDAAAIAAEFLPLMEFLLLERGEDAVRQFHAVTAAALAGQAAGARTGGAGA